MRVYLKTGLIVVAAGLASLGCLPYGLQFAKLLEPHHTVLYALAAIIFPAASCLANAALGVSSFFNMRRYHAAAAQANLLHLISFLSVLPIGCICYFGYYLHLPSLYTWTLTLAVILINTIIAHSAIIDFLARFNLKKLESLAGSELTFRALGFLIGFCVSLTAYMAAIHVLTGFFMFLLNTTQHAAYLFACFFGLISWLPFSILFANSTQITAGAFYHFLTKFKHQIKFLDWPHLALLLFALASGTAFSQMTLVFFGTDRVIPLFFKNDFIQDSIHLILVPLALLSSASVNFIALKNILLETAKERKMEKDKVDLFPL